MSHLEVDKIFNEYSFSPKLIHRLTAFFESVSVKNKKILDIGSHKGIWTVFYEQYGAKQIDCLEPIHDKLFTSNCKWIKTDLKNFKPTTKYDLVCSLNVHYHVKDCKEYFNNILSLNAPEIVVDGYFRSEEEPNKITSSVKYSINSFSTSIFYEDFVKIFKTKYDIHTIQVKNLPSYNDEDATDRMIYLIKK